MKAQETQLKHMLEGKRQYVIPLYQRRYAWTKKDWESFWTAVERQYQIAKIGGDALLRPTHFFGSLVVHPLPEMAHGTSKYNVIDGQQRLTTATALIAALRDTWGDKSEAERINESLLINKWQKDETRYKLYPGEHDRGDLAAVVDGKPEDAVGAIGGAYQWMKNRIELLKAAGPMDFPALEFAIMSRLEVVDVTTGLNDNAHRIFQTLNSTGKGLSQVDLLRNHFFMLLPNRADEAYKHCWSPMETQLGNWMDLFLWVETVSRGGGNENVPRDRVYSAWQDRLQQLEHDEDAVFNELAELKARASSYAKIVDPKSVTNAKLRRRLERLNEWGSNVHHPVALQVMHALDKQQSGVDEAAAQEALLLLESFMVRRMLAGIPTNNLNRIFTTTAGQVAGRTPLLKALHRSLSSAGKYWPTDEQVVAGIETRAYYLSQRSTQRQFILRRLEEAHPGRENVDWTSASFTVEHVMPQNLNQAWLEVLAKKESDPVVAHEELVHVLGNLTLTSDNPKLSDHPLARKQEILANSVLKMNKQIEQAPAWDRNAIDARGKELAQLAIKIWPAPIAPEELEAAADLDWKSSVAAVLGYLPDGAWVALDDLSDMLEVDGSAIREHLVKSDLSGRERVLASSGAVDLSFPWVTVDLAGYKSNLVANGVLTETTDEAAPQSQRLMADALAALANGN